MKKIITKAELKEIQKYWWQAGGFGGTLSSGIEYRSETTNGNRYGSLKFYDEDGEYDMALFFFEDDTVEEIEERLKAYLEEIHFELNKDFNLIKK